MFAKWLHVNNREVSEINLWTDNSLDRAAKHYCKHGDISANKLIFFDSLKCFEPSQLESLSKDTSLSDRTVSSALASGKVGYPEKNWTNQSNIKSIRGYPLISTYVQFSEKLTFLTPLYAHIRVRIRG